MSLFRNILRNTFTNVTDTITSYFNINFEDEIDNANAMLDLKNGKENGHILNTIESSVVDNKDALKKDKQLDCDKATPPVELMEANSLQELIEFEQIYKDFCEKSQLAECLTGGEINLDEFEDLFNDQSNIGPNEEDNIQRENSNNMHNELFTTFATNTVNGLPLEDKTLDTKDPEENSASVVNPEDNLVNEESDCDGYHSSDFEFISESEAKSEGLITKDYYDKPIKKVNVRSRNKFASKRPKIISSDNSSSKIPHLEHSSSGARGSILKYYRDKQKSREAVNAKEIALNSIDRPKSEFNNNKSYRKTHVIPNDNEFLNLFQGMNNPSLQQLHFAENKRVDVSPMTVQRWNLERRCYMRRAKRRTSTDDEFGDEAVETAEKIMSMHPQENRRCKRTLRTFAK